MQEISNTFVAVNNDFCHSWCDLPMIFMSGKVTRKNCWQIASLVIQKSLFTVSHALFYLSSAISLYKCPGTLLLISQHNKPLPEPMLPCWPMPSLNHNELICLLAHKTVPVCQLSSYFGFAHGYVLALTQRAHTCTYTCNLLSHEDIQMLIHYKVPFPLIPLYPCIGQQLRGLVTT